MIESEIQDTIAHAYEGLGLYAESEQHLRRAYELSAANRGPDAPETLDMLMALSGRLRELNKYADAVTMAKTAFETETRKLGPEVPKPWSPCRTWAHSTFSPISTRKRSR